MQRTLERITEWSARWPLLASALAYSALTAVAGRLVLSHPAASIFHDMGDPLLTAALLHWNAWTVPFTAAWWQFPIFVPTPDTMAFSEHLLGLSVVATPIEWVVRDPVVAANLVTLLTYPLCGLAAFLLARRLTGNAAAAFLAGLAYAFAPYRAAQQAHVQMLAGFWAPLVLLGLHGYIDSGRRRWLVLFGTAWLLQVFANLYSLYFLSALVALWVLWFVVLPGRWIQLRDIAVATLLALVPLAPTLITYVTVHARNGFVRPSWEAQIFSADLSGLLCAAPETAVWGWLQIGCRPESALFPGVVLLVLAGAAVVSLRRDVAGGTAPGLALRALRALAGIAAAVGAAGAVSAMLFGAWRFDVAGLRVSVSSLDKPLLVAIIGGLGTIFLSRTAIDIVRRRSIAGFYLCGAFVMWVFALGPTVTLNGVPRPIPGLFNLVLLLPGGSGIRAPGRFWLMSTLCLSMVAGLAASRWLAGRTTRAMLLLTALLAAGLLSDGWSTIPAAALPPPFPYEAALPGHTVLVLPVGTLDDFWPQFRAVAGGWRSINGYSGYEPKYYDAVRQGSRFEVDGLFEPFRERGDLFVVVNTDQQRLVTFVERQRGVEILSERFGAREYRLPRLSRAAPAVATVAARPIAQVSASCPAAEAAVDGNTATQWECQQHGHEWFVADLGAPVENVGAVRYTMGQSYREFPRDLTVETSVDGETWELGRTGDVIAVTIEGTLLDPLMAPTTVSFPPRRARFVRLRQTGKDEVNWAVPELAILAGG